MFGLSIVSYLFLGGAAGGLGCLAAIAGFAMPSPNMMGVDQRTTSRTICVYRAALVSLLGTAAILLTLSCLCLLVDLGGVNKLLPLLTQPRRSYVTFGSYLLPLTVILEVVLILFWRGRLFQNLWRGNGGTTRRARRTRRTQGNKRLQTTGTLLCKLLHGLLLVLSLSIMAYTGLFLASIKAVPLWHSLWLPVLFVFSSLSCGVVLLWVTIILSGSFRAFQNLVRQTMILDSVLMFLELLALSLLLIALSMQAGDTTATSRAAAESLTWLANGKGASWLLGGLVGFGLITPLGMEVYMAKSRRFTEFGLLAITFCVLVGAFLLRWIIVEAGVPPILFGS